MSAWVALFPYGSEQRLINLAASSGWLTQGTPVWRFLGGRSLGYLTPRGTSIGCCIQTVFGHGGVHVSAEGGDRQVVISRLEGLLGVTDVPELLERWRTAAGADVRIGAILRFAAVQSVAGPLLPAFEEVLRAALDDPEPVVRLAAVRALAVVPRAEAHALLAGRSDPDNPGLEDWRDLFAGGAGA